MISANININETWKKVTKIFMFIDNMWKPIKTGWIFVETTWRQFFNSVSAPVQLTSPSLSGSGAAFTNLTGTAGTYTSGTYVSKTSYIGAILLEYIPSGGLTDGLTTSPLGGVGSSPYIISQSDATTPVYYFYYVDAVVGNDSNTYYYYSNQIQAYIPTLIDDFTRSVSPGLGYMTPIKNASASPNSYIYGSHSINPNNWSVNGTQAVNSTSVTSGSTVYSSYSMQTLEVGHENVSLSANFPTGGGGMGMAFWVTSADSWWAATAEYNESTTTTTTCTGGPISTTSQGGGSCCDSPTGTNTCTGTKHSSFGTPSCTGGCSSYSDGLACGVTTTTTSCPTITGIDPLEGRRCSICTASTFYTCTDQSSVGQSTPPNTVSCTASGQICGYTVSLVGNVFVYYPTKCVLNTQNSYLVYAQQYSCNDLQTTYTCHTNVSSQTTNYNTNIVIYSSVSGTVSSSVTNIASSTSSFTLSKNLVINVLNGTIGVSAYDAVNGTNKIGSTVISIPSLPTKSLLNGESSIGVFKGWNRRSLSTGTILDDFYYVRL